MADPILYIFNFYLLNKVFKCYFFSNRAIKSVGKILFRRRITLDTVSLCDILKMCIIQGQWPCNIESSSDILSMIPGQWMIYMYRSIDFGSNILHVPYVWFQGSDQDKACSGGSDEGQREPSGVLGRWHPLHPVWVSRTLILNILMSFSILHVELELEFNYLTI